jgi:hypothetical protein
MAPHEKTQSQSARALDKIQARWPMTFSRLQVQTGSGNDIDLVVHAIPPRLKTF